MSGTQRHCTTRCQVFLSGALSAETQEGWDKLRKFSLPAGMTTRLPPQKKMTCWLAENEKISWSKHINKDHQIHCFSSSVDSTVPNQTEFKLSSSIWEKIQSLAQCRSLPAFFHRNGGRTNHFVGVGVGKMHVISSWCTVQVSIRICCYVLKFERLYLLQTTQHSKTPKRVMKLHRSMKSNNQMKPFVSPVYSEPLVARQLHRTSSMQDLRMDHRTHVSFP